MSESPVVYGISKWLNTYINAKNLSGMFNFKFIECSETREVFCLEGNPHIHSAIVNFREKSEVFTIRYSVFIFFITNSFELKRYLVDF